MSKFVANDIFLNKDSDSLFLTFSIPKSNYISAEQSYKEITKIKNCKSDSKFTVSIKELKSSRSLEQNKMLWALIEKLTIAQSGYKRKEDVEQCYCDLLEKANIESEYYACLPRGKETLEQMFRVVKKIGERTVQENGTKLDVYQCYLGTSLFNTKQMSELIDCVLDALALLGVNDSEITSIIEEYKCKK